ncbi:inositol 1,4,5-triphosphate receptor associated 2 [Trichomycterus rosablanca]|uniref:inositol 1,4,5-triphosphate receptor associated 2 n=1 Tax=Trichomycterus rosablanca TaxID=2290929 RepID=UPI002F357180
MDIGVTPRRHNPVDSICRKLQTIQRRDREPNSPFQIPKLQSNSYDSPHTGLRRNLDTILKKRKGDSQHDVTAFMLSPGGSRGPSAAPNIPITPLTPVNATYTSTLGTLAERGSTVPKQSRPWQLSCSTPAVHNSDNQFSFTPGEKERGKGPAHGLLSYNLNFYSSDASNILDSELPYPALVVKRLSMGDNGTSAPSELKKESMAEVSLICEEDLLDSIFQACDTQCRGKVYVSHIVDYLRHTTSRSSEDSGLEELCNMLDPEQKDISIDLDTYHAIMKEWIEDCRNQVKDDKDSLTPESVKLPGSLSAKRSMLLNMTSGSLEAFGGEASRAELETSDLVFCVADLQFNNQKLQEHVRKLKQAVETMEETNQKLIEENEELKNQAKMGQQLLQKELMLKEEVEEMKLTLSSSEENKARATAQSKLMERENQTLITKISSLQDENLKVSKVVDELQKKMKVLYELNTDLQAQTLSFDAVISEKDRLIQEKTNQIDELKAAILEYSSITELLRAEKSKLENQMQMLQPDVAMSGLSLSVAYRLNQTGSGSLETELALAQQNPVEGAEHLSSVSFASPLDETLDREVLFLLQGPTPEQMSLEFKLLINRLRQEREDATLAVLGALQGFRKSQESQNPDTNFDLQLQGLQVQLEQQRGEWTNGLEQLKQYTDSLEKELLKMASNMRRSRTEILHLSVRVQEQEIQKQQLCDELEQLKTRQNCREASCQTEDDLQQAIDNQEDSSPEWDKLYPLLDSPVEEKLPFIGEDKTGQNEPTAEDEQLQTDLTEPKTSEEVHSEEVEESALVEDRKAPHDSVGDTEEPGGLSKSITETETCETLAADKIGVQDHGGTQEEESRLPECNGPHDTHEHSVCCNAAEAASPSHSHPLCTDEPALNHVEALPQSTESTPPQTSNIESNPIDRPEPFKSISLPESSPQQSVDLEIQPEAETDPASMSNSQKLTQDQTSDAPTASERSGLMPVAEEEEPVPEAVGGTAALAKSGGAAATPNAAKTAGSSQSSSQATANVNPVLSIRSTFKKDLETPDSIDMQDDENSVVGEDGLTQSEKQIEAEFHQLSLSQRCDLFTLEKRLRLEERSRDLAEENVRKEVSSCQGLLQALIPLCGEDNQALEIIQRLQKNLDILIQSVSRVSSRSEMLGAIHQEARMGKAVEVMIQHVENLRRTFTKEHAELLELRESGAHKNNPFASKTEKAEDVKIKKPIANQFYKLASSRRISQAAMGRAEGGQTPADMAKDGTDADKLSSKSPKNMVGNSAQRAPLKRFFSSGSWAETDVPSFRYGCDAGSHSEANPHEQLKKRRSSLTELGNKITSFVMPAKTNPSPTTEKAAPVTAKTQNTEPSDATNANPCSWLAILILLVGFLMLLGKLLLQPAVNAAPVGTGDSWMTIQQILWPFTGLRHNGRPPV